MGGTSIWAASALREMHQGVTIERRCQPVSDLALDEVTSRRMKCLEDPFAMPQSRPTSDLPTPHPENVLRDCLLVRGIVYGEGPRTPKVYESAPPNKNAQKIVKSIQGGALNLSFTSLLKRLFESIENCYQPSHACS